MATSGSRRLGLLLAAAGFGFGAIAFVVFGYVLPSAIWFSASAAFGFGSIARTAEDRHAAKLREIERQGERWTLQEALDAERNALRAAGARARIDR